jgi:hypothetical protein
MNREGRLPTADMKLVPSTYRKIGHELTSQCHYDCRSLPVLDYFDDTVGILHSLVAKGEGYFVREKVSIVGNTSG